MFFKMIKYYKNIKNHKNTTNNKKLTTLKYMINISIKHKFIDENNLTMDKLPNDEERFKVLSDSEFKSLKQHLDKLPLKHKVIISMFMNTGIRCTEFCKLKLKNIDFSNNSILLEHTKNNKKRFSFLTKETAYLIIELINTC